MELVQSAIPYKKKYTDIYRPNKGKNRAYGYSWRTHSEFSWHIQQKYIANSESIFPYENCILTC